MKLKEALNLKQDIEKNLTDDDFNEDLYISVRGVGTKTFKRCAYHDAEGWLFIWTQKDTFVLDKNDLGDFVSVPLSETQISFL